MSALRGNVPYNEVMDIQQKVAAFFEQYPKRSFDKRQLLIQAEEPIEVVFYILSGRVSQYDVAPNGNEVVVNVFKPGAFFPMSSAINGTPNYYFFEASLPTTARVAPKADAVAFLKSEPAVTFDLLARVYRGVDGVLRRMAHLMGGDAHTRLVFELVNAAHRFGEQDSGQRVVVQLTEGDLAKHSGLARETVSRILQRLKAAQLIENDRGGFVIHNLAELEDQLGNTL